MRHVYIPSVPILRGLPMDQAHRDLEQWFQELRLAMEQPRDQSCQCPACTHERHISALEVKE